MIDNEWTEVSREKKSKIIKNISEEDIEQEDSVGEEDSESGNKKYIEPKILDNVNLEHFFSKEDVNRSNKKLQITDKGLYSISRHNDAKWITNLIKKFIKNETDLDPDSVEIIDSTAGIGGNTIHFAKNFNKVKSIEINSIHYNVLKNNIDALNIQNVEIYLDNFMNQIKDQKCKGDIFFMDPPWGGKSYKNYKYFSLKIGKLPLSNVLNLLFEENYKYVVLKAPYNLNISLLLDTVNYQNMNVYKNNRKNMLILFFY